ncbi:MAG: prephenate dehydratase [Actinobacteria bacterium]|nr:prephenate dehydratase [Actinomycetota bacterium]
MKIAYLGPPGTFTEEARLSDPAARADATELVPMQTINDVLAAVHAGEVDRGFVAIENSIEGTVNITLDTLVFGPDLLIQREVATPIRLHLVGREGAELAQVRQVMSFPHAIAQCREWLKTNIPDAEMVAANSTAEAVALVAQASDATLAAIGTSRAAELHDLALLASDIEDHVDNETRFVALTRSGIPAPTGHDKTSIVCFQRADHPGSLHSILGQFSARDLNLTKLESRPTKKGLGDYCFVIDLQGHVDDEVIADCLRDLHAQLPALKFLGSYPAAGQHSESRRRDAEESWRNADSWVRALKSKVGRGYWRTY